jgi:Domain of unknown function (DUF3472)
MLKPLRIGLVLAVATVAVAVPAAPAQAAIRPVQPYSWWQNLGSGYWNLDQRLTIQKHTPSSTLFWAHQIGFVGMSEGGYLGLQVFGPTKLALFSMWGATASRGAECGPFVEDGTGHSCRITNYNWTTGRAYRLRVWALETTATGRWWGAWVQDTTTGVDSHVGAVFVPFFTLLDSRVSWIEYFGGDLPSCDAVPVAKAFWEFPTANNGAIRSSSAVNIIGTGTDCPDSAKVTDVTGGTVQQMGPHVGA